MSNIIDYIEYKDLIGESKTNLDKIPVLYEDNHVIVVVKPAGIASQKDKTNDISLIEIVKRYLKEKYDKKGEVYLGLIHRLDVPTTRYTCFCKNK